MLFSYFSAALHAYYFLTGDIVPGNELNRRTMDATCNILKYVVPDHFAVGVTARARIMVNRLDELESERVLAVVPFALMGKVEELWGEL